MVATFCLRLAFGMIAPLLLLNPEPIPPRFFRVQFLSALALVVAAISFEHPVPQGLEWFEHLEFGTRLLQGKWLLSSLWASIIACFVGGILWHTDSAPFGRVCFALAGLALGSALFFAGAIASLTSAGDFWFRIADNYAAAAIIGIATSAMLLGHSYLISPAMTIVPLQRLLIAGCLAIGFRVALALGGLWLWTAEHPLPSLETETLLWLSVRWLLGIFAPLVLGWMAWETTRIRSTQSATGILYVVVIVVFLGELTSLLLLQKTGAVL